MRILYFLIGLLLISGCATAHKMNRISLGMTKEEVIQAMGPPISVSAREGVEYLNYSLSETASDDFHGWTTPYFVRIINGKVEAYGRKGDFDSTKTPEQKIIIDLKNKP